MLAALLLAAAAGPVATPPPPADPQTATVHTEDADRFAALFERTGGAPTAQQLQREYLDRGSYGVHVFTDGRIENAANLARQIAERRAKYADAIRRCLPVVKRADGELRAIYLALHGLLPEQPLPQIYVVFGADNSGGTAGPGAQVLGLETLCGLAGNEDALRTVLRAFFAHETVHVFQKDQTADPLLAETLKEGAADFIATLVTGRQIDPARAAWGAAHEAELWRQFEADLAAMQGAPGSASARDRAAAFHRWIGNYGSAPEGWPGEAGYWVGQRIWERWYAKQPDKRAAIRRMLTLERLDEVLAGGPYAK